MITKENVKDIYGLSPLQEGMLFHSLMDADSEAYFEQMEYRIVGDLSLELFEKSWNEVIKRHEILRTAFVHNKTEKPIQIVLRERPISVQRKNLMGLDEIEQRELINSYKSEDKTRGFELGKEELIRISVFQTNREVYHVVWSHHHILLDGWSVVKIKSDFLNIYQSLQTGAGLHLPPIRPYSQYIKWLAGQDTNASLNFWKERLIGYEALATVPFAEKSDSNTGSTGTYAFSFSKEYTKALQNMAVGSNVTLNTCIQSVWGVLMGHYNDTRDVVFGTTVSGRPTGLSGVEDMVGLFINTIPVRIQQEKEDSFESLAKRAQLWQLQSEKHHYVRLSDIQSETTLKNQLFDHLVVFENYPVGETLSAATSAEQAFRIESIDNHESTNYPFNVLVHPGEQLRVKFMYDTSVFSEKSVRRIQGHFEELLTQLVANSKKPLTQIDCLTDAERTQLLSEFGVSRLKNTEDGKADSILELIKQRTLENPESLAVSYEGKDLTYHELDVASNRVANYLENNYNLSDGKSIGLMLHRSDELIVCMLGILKAGAAYVSLDPEYPKERIRFILDSLEVETVLFDPAKVDRSEFDPVDFTAVSELSAGSDQDLDKKIRGDQTIYTLFTSGSTGVPKGVSISHQNVVACTEGLNQLVHDYDTALATTSANFDVSVSELLVPLTMGKKVRVLNSHAELPQWIEKENEVFVMTIPSVMEALWESGIAVENIACIGLAGDVFPRRLAEKLRASSVKKVFNLYGPTEDTIYSTYFDLAELHENLPGVSIGYPMLHTDVYVLSARQQLLPVGIVGELYLSGKKLSKGYINREEETAKRFVPNPFKPGEKMYRTGDLVRWMEDGSIEFLGRIDNQVKLNGFRIELEEIESILGQQEGIVGVKAVAKELSSGKKILMAYYTGSRQSEEETKQALADRVPYYMVPEHILHLDEFPVNVNGKIDISKLPAVNESALTDSDRALPETEKESVLLDVWKHVLQRDDIGVNDNYYHLGGDSIKAIQIIAGLFKRSYKGEIKDLFTYKTIRAWGPYLNHKEQLVDQEMVSGDVPLGPVQRWFFNATQTAREHFNQSTILKSTERLDVERVDQVLKKLVLHHDALRMQYRFDGNEIHQRNGGDEVVPECMLIDLTNSSDPSRELTVHAKEIQRSFNLENGPLVKAVVYRMEDADHLFLCIHHLVVDGVSWRILQEDFQQLYDSESANLGPKTHSYKYWSEELARFAMSAELYAEKAYWEKVASEPVADLPEKKTEGVLKYGRVNKLRTALTADLTRQLIGDCHKAYTTEVNDVLLTALARSLSKWSNGTNHLITLEGHGREVFREGMNISRTIGWFTSMYPVRLKAENASSIEESLIETKEMLRHIPNKGMGYGCLRYLRGEEELHYTPKIAFNYLGEFNPTSEKDVFERSNEEVGPDFSPEGEIAYSLTINAAVYDGEMQIDCFYHQDVFDTDKISELVDGFKQELRTITEHCIGQRTEQKTPSDFLYDGFDPSGLNTFLETNGLNNGEIEDIYPLAPMQEGMFFHAQYNPESSSYLEQTSFVIEGTLNEELFHECWNQLVRRYDVLRTRYFSMACPVPLQVVMKNQNIDFIREDWTKDSSETQKERLIKFKQADRQRKFHLDKGPLIRITLVRMSQSVWTVIWSYHHIMMDGWCSSLVQRAFLEMYRAKLENRKPNLQPAPQFRDYLEWLSGRDQQTYSDYWKEYLDGFAQVTGIPELKKLEEGAFSLKKHEFQVSEELTGRLKQVAVRYELTMNTLLQAAWAILLGRYNRTNDVVFGATVSGRPGELESVSEIVGLFINTIPVRVKIDEEKTFAQLVSEVNQQRITSKDHSYYSLARIQSDSMLHGQLHNHVLVYENYPIDEEIASLAADASLGFILRNTEVKGQTNYDLAIAVMPKNGLHFEVGFNECLYSRKQISQVADHIQKALNVIGNDPEILVKDISIVAQNEQKILQQEVKRDFDIPSDSSMVEIFSKQVEIFSQSLAIIDGEERLTYRELDEKSNQIASWLHQTYRISQGDRVAVLSNLSYHSIYVFLGILKLGATYLPLNADGPVGRNQLILERADCAMILSDGSIDTSVYEMSHANWNDARDSDVSGEYSPGHDQTPYLIHTSGTTGRPKGVEIRQSGIINCVLAMAEVLDFNPGDRLLQFFPYTFDVSHYQVYQALLTGGTLVLASQEHRDNPPALVDYLNKEEVTVMGLPPAYFATLSLEEIETVKVVYTGGEAPSSDLINRVLEKGLRYFNLYGLTETSCNSLYYEVLDPIGSTEKIPIGKAIANTETMVLTEYNQLQPTGAIGEICIAGDGLAKGYFHDEELTANRFVPHPLKKGEKLFRTGDLGKYDAQGNILFVGRKDHQISLRGHRIEIGEVEFCILRYTGITQTSVALLEHEEEKHLVGYFKADQKVDNVHLREYLVDHLPSASIPSHWVQVEEFPLTRHGKIDKKALPQPDWAAALDKANYVAPSTANEQLLVDCWKDVLGVDPIGVKDNFFDLGGDSIKAIQIVSRVAMHQKKLVVKDIFEAPTIAELTGRISDIDQQIDQSKVEGILPLTPIQQWFFETFESHESHFNQSVLLESTTRLNPETVRATMDFLGEHHDALRTTFNGAFQECQAEVESHIELIDLRNEPRPEIALETRASSLQSSFDLNKGPLAKLLIARMAERDRLFIVIHHLIIDGVSWRVLLEDFQSVYKQLDNGKNAQLPQKTTSYKEWSNLLKDYANSTEIIDQTNYWKEVESKIQKEPRLVVANNHPNVFGETVYEQIDFSEEITEQLMRSSNAAFRTEINDLLLLALTRAMKQLTGSDSLSLTMEGHGREELHQTVDISRTIGWFTSAFPVHIDIEGKENLVDQIKHVKEALRNIPNKGMGYGVLRYLTDKLDATPHQPEISFNFLGEMASNKVKGDLYLVDGKTGSGVSPTAPMPYELLINGIVTDNKLSFSCGYNPVRMSGEKVQAFMTAFKRELVDIAEFCAARTTTELTPGDFLVSGMSMSHYENLLETNNWSRSAVKNIYPLSPLQNGLFFHSLQNEVPTAYFQQMSYRMEGHLNADAFDQAWQYLVDRYDLLRTAFIERQGEEPIQVVLNQLDFKVNRVDLSDFPANEQLQLLKEAKEKNLNTPFELNKAGLMRLSLFKLGENNYEVVWSYHHILMDGWCQGIIKRDFFAAYKAFSEGRSPELSEEVPYSRYIQWLQKQDGEKSLSFWKQYLGAIEESMGVPQTLDSKESGKKHASIQLSKDDFDAINAFTSKEQCTMNVLIQSVWGTLLNRYHETSASVFGAIVSGRPSEISGIEEMVGLLINTIPVVIAGEEEMTVSEFIRSNQQKALEAENHHHVSLAEIQAQTDHKQTLIDHIMIFENYPMDKELEKSGAAQGDVSFSGFEMHEQTTYGLVVLIIPSDTLEMRIEYDSAKYDERMISQVLRHFENLLKAMIQNSETPLARLSLMDETEKEQLTQVAVSNLLQRQFSGSISEVFESVVKDNPDAMALSYGDQKLTFAELNERATRIAGELQSAHQIKKGQSVGILLPQGVDVIASMLGVLKSGATYVPIDPEYPQERIDFILKDAKARVIISDKKNESYPTLIPSECTSNVYKAPKIQEEDSAYIIYTSGSTGVPKGVRIHHGAVLNLVEGLNETVYNNYQGQLNVALMAATVFDASVQQIFGSLLNGHCLVLSNPEIKRDDKQFSQFIQLNDIDILDATPSLIQLLMQGSFALEKETSLKHVLVGGEALPTNLMKTFFHRKTKGVRVTNVYGPTECTVDATYYHLTAETELIGATIPIGKPLPNHQLYVLDQNGEPTPMGVPGEIYIGGRGVSQGYVNRPDITETHFVSNPFGAGKMYRTGDIGRLDFDGNLTFIKRKDNQIKIRGHRIELGEIESVIREYPGVLHATVLLQKVGVSDELVTYYGSNNWVSGDELKQYIRQKLPGYAVPNFYTEIAEIPLTTNGKVNRKMLAKIGVQSVGAMNESSQPINETEKVLVRIWENVLGIEGIGVETSFFDLGGHSLSAMKLRTSIQRTLNRKIHISDIFNAQTIREQARIVEGKRSEMKSTRVLRLNRHQSGNETMIFIPPVAGTSMFYQPLAKLLEDRYNAFGLQMSGLDEGDDNYNSIDEIVEDFMTMIREIQPNGPYKLFGYSMGVNIALELCVALEKSGDTCTLILADGNIDHFEKELSEVSFEKMKGTKEWNQGFELFLSGLNFDAIRQMEKLINNNLKLMGKHRFSYDLAADMRCFEAQDTVPPTRMNELKKITNGRFEHHLVAGDHYGMFAKENLEALSMEILERKPVL